MFYLFINKSILNVSSSLNVIGRNNLMILLHVFCNYHDLSDTDCTAKFMNSRIDLLAYLVELKDFNNIAERNDEVLKQSHFRTFFNKDVTVEEVIKSLYKSDEILRRS